MHEDLAQTKTLLQRWHAGDKDALGRLLDRDLAWIRSRVQSRMGQLLSAKGQIDDYVQDAMIEILRYGPRFVMSDKAQFRALMARIVENTLRGHAASLKRQRRAADREFPIAGTDTILYLDPPADRDVTRPSDAAARSEDQDWVRLAVDLLPPEDASIVRLREWEELEFAEIAERLGLSTDAARMRFNRCLPRLARLVHQLRSGDVQAALATSMIDER